MVEQHNPATLVTREQVVCEDERPTRGIEHPAIRVRFERPLFERHVVGWGRAPDDPVVEPRGDPLGEGGWRDRPGGGVVADLGGDLLDDREALGRMGYGGAGQGEGVGPKREWGGGERRVVGDGVG